MAAGDEEFKQFVMSVARDMARRTLRDQDFDDLVSWIDEHKKWVPTNIWANVQIYKAFTILDSVWDQGDMELNDYGDEQCDAMYCLQVSILGVGEVNSGWEGGK